MSKQTIFTIGHSTHKLDYFITLLEQYNINCLIDVRSTPFSRIAPQFNKEELQLTLRSHGIIYIHFREEFGARHTSPTMLDAQGKVDFEKVRNSEEFRRGIERVRNGLMQGYRITLMCSEADPFDCHRFAMISYQLIKEDIIVKHILKTGNTIDNEVLEQKMLKKYWNKLPQCTLFEEVSLETQIEAGYRLRGRDVAFVPLKQQPSM